MQDLEIFDYREYFSIWDIVLLPFYLVLIFFIANRIKNKYLENNEVYKYYTVGLFAKIFGGIIFCFIYLFYYPGGDTTQYYIVAKQFNALLPNNPLAYLSILFNGDVNHINDIMVYHGLPYYMYFDEKSLAVSRFVSPFLLLSFNKYILSTVLLSAISFLGVWRLYLVFCEEYPKYTKQHAIAILFIPSLIFWGSGIVKDTFTFSAVCWFTYSFYKVFIKKQKIWSNILPLIITPLIIISIKPYIIIALLPGTLLWASFFRIKAIKNKILKTLSAPLLITAGLLVGLSIISLFSESLDRYSSVNGIIEKAIVTQQDLIRGEDYSENYFNIGEFDNSLTSILSKTPLAITAGLFRPYLWEARNPVMLISGMENFIFLILLIYVIIKGKFINTFKIISQEPLIIFSFIFAFIFAFAVGLSTANFGALVRYKIPAIPFFFSGILIIRRKLIEATNQKKHDFLE